MDAMGVLEADTAHDPPLKSTTTPSQGHSRSMDRYNSLPNFPKKSPNWTRLTLFRQDTDCRLIRVTNLMEIDR